MVDSSSWLGLATPPKISVGITSGTGKATDFKFGQYISQGPSEQKPIKNFGGKGVSAYPGIAQFLKKSTPLSQERVKIRI